MHMEPILCGGEELLQEGVVITKNLLQVFTKWGSLKTLPTRCLSASVCTTTSGLKPQLLLERSRPCFLSENSIADQQVLVFTQQRPLSQVSDCLHTIHIGYRPYKREQQMSTDVGRRGSRLQHCIQAVLLRMTWQFAYAHTHTILA